MDRREFIVGSAVATATIGLLTCVGCGDDDSNDGEDAATQTSTATDTTTTGDSTAPGLSASIAANHGHTLLIGAEALESTSDTEYTITGGSHTHKVTVSTANFASLKAGETVKLTSTKDNAHAHSITLKTI